MLIRHAFPVSKLKINKIHLGVWPPPYTTKHCCSAVVGYYRILFVVAQKHVAFRKGNWLENWR